MIRLAAVLVVAATVSCGGDLGEADASLGDPVDLRCASLPDRISNESNAAGEITLCFDSCRFTTKLDCGLNDQVLVFGQNLDTDVRFIEAAPLTSTVTANKGVGSGRVITSLPQFDNIDVEFTWNGEDWRLTARIEAREWRFSTLGRRQ